MHQAIIDIGSNSMRLTVYEADGADFKILFKEKVMAGLAGYVENGHISNDGIRQACEGLLEFKKTLSLVGINDNIHVFATASLRNIKNTAEAAKNISETTGFEIDIITGEEEAILGYIGVMRKFSVSDGVFVDIGGASTEISVFKNNALLFSKSYQIGSLKLYKECVKKILPGEGSIKRIRKIIKDTISDNISENCAPQKKLICIGGTARTILKLAKRLNLISENENSIKEESLKNIGELLTGDKKNAADMILKTEPERIHTMVPGYLILQYIAERFGAKEITISDYGVREGYLCRKILS